MTKTETPQKDANTAQKDTKMLKVMVADEISPEGIELLESAVTVKYDPKITPEQLLEQIGEYDGLLVRSRTKVTAEVLKRGTKLKVVGRAGVGVDNIDIIAATEAGILVINSPEGNTASAAEHTVALMMSLARCVPSADKSMKEGKWERSKYMGSELFNKTLGVIGLGKVGGRVAQACQAMGMKVIVYDPFFSPERAAQMNIQSVSLEEIWKRADFITIHTPKTRETTGMISGAVLQRMKQGVRIVNCSRGGIIDEQALAKAITDGKVAGAALDVFDNEPPKDSPLLALGDKVVLTPHLGASTVEAQFNVAIDLAEQMRDYLTTGLARSPVNLPFMRPDILKSLGKYVWLAEAMGAIAGELSEGNVKEIEIIAYGGLSQKDTKPLAVAALRGMLLRRMETVTYVNAELIAKNNGIHVRESKGEQSGQFHEELSIMISTDKGVSSLSGTVLPHDEPIITHINDHPINLTPQRFMLFTSHRDQPGMVAKVAGALGKFDVNISTMSVGRKGVREHAVMVMTLDDPIKPELVSELTNIEGIHMAKFVSLLPASHMPA
ncbi:MAG TPA: phosphoglycerate dehydrogenase [Drouetiella sp.]